MDFKPSMPMIVSLFVMLGIVAVLLLVLVTTSYGPGLAQMWPQ
jgi:hypothetical protein